MTNLQLSLQRACYELDLSIIIPFLLTVRKDIQINAQALLPKIGAQKGMIIVNRYDDLLGIASDLSVMGYGYSVLGDPLPAENYNLESYIDMFSDWGWGSSIESKPEWMK